MEAANRGAVEEARESIGLNIVLPHEQLPNRYVTPDLSFQFHYFALRKMHFLLRARAVAVFPGGYGTFDEFFELLTLIQTGKVRPLPILLFGISPGDLDLSMVRGCRRGLGLCHSIITRTMAVPPWGRS